MNLYAYLFYISLFLALSLSPFSPLPLSKAKAGFTEFVPGSGQSMPAVESSGPTCAAGQHTWSIFGFQCLGFMSSIAVQAPPNKRPLLSIGSNSVKGLQVQGVKVFRLRV